MDFSDTDYTEFHGLLSPFSISVFFRVIRA